MIWTAITALLSKIPLKVIAYPIAVISLVGMGFLWGHSGPAKEFADYKDAEKLRASAIKEKSSEVTERVVTSYVPVIKYVEVQGAAIIKKVPVYVPRNVCTLPGSFRRLHDAAATGSDLPDSPGNSDAAPVDAQDVASTLAENYTAAIHNAQQLRALQDWVYQQQDAHAVKQ